MIDSFLKFEHDHGLLSDTIDGFTYWPYIRFSVYERIFDNPEGCNDCGQRKQKIRFLEIIEIIKNIITCNPLLRKGRKDILVISHQRRVLKNDKYICMYTDLLSKKYKNDSICAEFLYGYKHFKPIENRNILMLDIVDVLPYIQNIIYKDRYRATFSKLDGKAVQLSRLIAVELKKEIEPGKLADWMKRRYVWYQYKKPILREFLEDIRPKVIIEVVGYETDKMILNEIANEMGICTIELQHGVIGRGHCAYNYLDEKKYSYMPAILFVFSDYWKETCRFPIGKENIITTGFPYMEEQMNCYPPTGIDEKVLRIIVISQPGVTERLIDFTCSIIKEMEKIEKDYKIIFKLHPEEYNNISKRIILLKKSENIQIITDSSISLYSLFSECDYQIGINSTAIFEGLSYGLATFIYTGSDADVESYMCDLRKKNYVRFGKTSRDFLSFLELCKNREKNINDNLFFKKNSLETMKTKIDAILENSYG